MASESDSAKLLEVPEAGSSTSKDEIEGDHSREDERDVIDRSDSAKLLEVLEAGSSSKDEIESDHSSEDERDVIDGSQYKTKTYEIDETEPIIGYNYADFGLLKEPVASQKHPKLDDKENVVEIHTCGVNLSHHCLKLHLDVSIKSVQTFMAKYFGYPPDEPGIYKGIILKSDRSLRSYGIGDDHCLYMRDCMKFRRIRFNRENDEEFQYRRNADAAWVDAQVMGDCL